MAKTGKIIRNGITYSGGSGGCDIEYLTQAEYDALPDSKLTNGVEYRITDSNPPAPTAKDMSYDNLESGIEAETVQDAIDEVNESLEGISNSQTWKLAGSANGTTAINLPSKFNELQVVVKFVYDNSNIGYSFNFIYDILENTDRIFFCGYGLTPNNAGGAKITISKTKLIAGWICHGHNTISDYATAVYYR